MDDAILCPNPMAFSRFQNQILALRIDTFHRLQSANLYTLWAIRLLNLIPKQLSISVDLQPDSKRRSQYFIGSSLDDSFLKVFIVSQIFSGEEDQRSG